MKVTHISTSLIGGAGNAVLRSHRALMSSGVESQILSLNTGVDNSDQGVIKFHRSRIQRVNSRIITRAQNSLIQLGPELLTPISLSYQILEHESISGADVIHAHANFNFFGLKELIALQAAGKQVVLTLHDQRYFTGGCHYALGCTKYKSGCLNCPQATKLGSYFVRESQRKNVSNWKQLSRVKLISPSTWLKEKAIECGFAQPDNISVISNPIPDTFLCKENTHAAFEDNVLVVGFCSFDITNPYKGFELLATALEALAQKRPEIKVKLLVVGKGKIDKIPKKIEIEVKSVSDDFKLFRELSRMNMLVVPSLADNSPSVIGESLMAGTPVIGSTAGGIPELIDKKVGGTFRSEDPSALLEAIEKAYKPSNPQEISSRAHSKFSEREYAQKAISLYGG
jgi:glycosyltransferase involved in cell wall biosynthesis